MENAKLRPGKRLWRVDCKTIVTKRGNGNPYRIKPVMKAAGMMHILNALLGDPSLKDVNQSLMGDGDLLLFHDGRVQRNTDTWNKEVGKRMKLNKAFWPTRGAGILRMLYTDREFEAGGYAAPAFRAKASTALSKGATSPEPLETCTLLKPKSCVLPEVPRRHLSLPGSNRDRGWAGCSMKSDEDRLLYTVTTECWEAVLPENLKDQQTEAVESEESEDAPAVDCDAKSVAIFPWEANEAVSRECFNCFTDGHTIVDMFGSPTAAVAACRDRLHYAGFCATE